MLARILGRMGFSRAAPAAVAAVPIETESATIAPPTDVPIYVRDTLEKLYLGVQYAHVCDVHGDIAEFGTQTGRTAKHLAKAIRESETQFSHAMRLAEMPGKRLHLFDSFEGLPVVTSDVDKQSPHVATGIWGAGELKGLSDTELFEQCAQELSPDRISVYKGWFSDSIPRIPTGTKFSLVHVDSDLYESARDVLEGVFSRGMVAEGATLFFDDWNCNRASPSFGERRAWAEVVRRYSIEYSDAGEYGVVSHKFIVHRYKADGAVR